MADIRVVVFDIDGTLIDTREFILQAYQHTIQKHGYPVPARATIAALIGHKIEECYAVLVPGVETAPLVADHALFQAGNINLTHAYDGAREVIDAIKNRGLKIVLWTGRKEHIQTVLSHCGFDQDEFAAVVDAQMVEHGKPDPEGLLLGLGIADLLPEQAIMVGDAVVDIEAGRHGGVAATIAVTHGFGTRDALIGADPDYMVNSLPELLPIIAVLVPHELDI